MSCPACGANEWRSRAVLVHLIVRTCARCGLLASEIDAVPSHGYAQIDDVAYADAFGSLRRRQALDVLRMTSAFARSGRWLDIGCGPGYLLEEAANAGFAIGGIEPDPKAASLARSRLGESVVREGMFDRAEPRAFDVVSTLDVFEHIPLASLAAFANDVRTSLRDGGVWTIKLPSSEGLYFRAAHALRFQRGIERVWQVGYESPHTVYFSSSSLERFLARNGFEVVARRYLQELPLSAAVARLTMDGGVSRWQAMLALPAIAMINSIEALRRKSDALMVVARAS